jgi:hypothetical protein
MFSKLVRAVLTRSRPFRDQPENVALVCFGSPLIEDVAVEGRHRGHTSNRRDDPKSTSGGDHLSALARCDEKVDFQSAFANFAGTDISRFG